MPARGAVRAARARVAQHACAVDQAARPPAAAARGAGALLHHVGLRVPRAAAAHHDRVVRHCGPRVLHAARHAGQQVPRTAATGLSVAPLAFVLDLEHPIALWHAPDAIAATRAAGRRGHHSAAGSRVHHVATSQAHHRQDAARHLSPERRLQEGLDREQHHSASVRPVRGRDGAPTPTLHPDRRAHRRRRHTGSHDTEYHRRNAAKCAAAPLPTTTDGCVARLARDSAGTIGRHTRGAHHLVPARHCALWLHDRQGLRSADGQRAERHSHADHHSGRVRHGAAAAGAARCAELLCRESSVSDQVRHGLRAGVPVGDRHASQRGAGLHHYSGSCSGSSGRGTLAARNKCIK